LAKRKIDLKEISMPVIQSLADLKQISAAARQKQNSPAALEILVAMGSCGIAAGARETLNSILDYLKNNPAEGVSVRQTGCVGLCSEEPLLRIRAAGQPDVFYGKVTPSMALTILQNHLPGGKTPKKSVGAAPQAHTLEAGSVQQVLESALRNHGNGRDALIPILAEVNQSLGYLPAEVLTTVARQSHQAQSTAPLSASQANDVATFYSMFSTQPLGEHVVRFCENAPCHVVGGQAVFEALQDYLKIGPGETSADGKWSLQTVSCLGLCAVGPVFMVDEDMYGNVTPEKIAHIFERYTGSAHENSGAELPAQREAPPAEERIVLRRAGQIDPDSLKDYLAEDGYQALGKALTAMTPQQVIATLEESGLQGRGGAGFPTGRKWKFVAATSSAKKYVICNADESEPGTFKDRLVLEGDPHAMLEAMAIAGYAVGADEGYIYVRGEYREALRHLETAIRQAEAWGLLGKNILGSGFSFKIHLHAGAGAYVCGEETALIESLEGKRGEPRSRPPYPTTNGLWDKPTLVNNVETLANVPAILLHGAAWYRQFGTPSSPGTKVFTIMGKVNHTGVIEAPMGTTLREIIETYAGGMQPGATFKLAQTGGSSGSIIPASLQDTPLDFESFRAAGVSLGSGALLICDEKTCVVDLVKVLVNFFRVESCGKCTPCRLGTQRGYEILTAISQGRGRLEDLDTLEAWFPQLELLSNCGLGQTALVPARDMLKHFRAEVEAHIRQGICPSAICPMKTPEITEETR